VLLLRPQGLLGKTMKRRASTWLATLAGFYARCPPSPDRTALSVATLILYFAYTGQAWNVMMGFAGQLSLGHSLYVGVGAYAAAALFFHFGIGPWAGLWLAMLLCVALGLVIGFLAFRFGISGVYFALLTIAFAEFTRIGFDHFDWLGGPGGMFLKVAQRDTSTCSTSAARRDVLLRAVRAHRGAFGFVERLAS
jgi:branched-chain amino acid transport system permease protein